MHYLAENIPPDTLIHKDLYESEGAPFYSLLRSVIEACGRKIPYSRLKPAVVNVAELMYLSANREEMSEEEKNREDKDLLFVTATTHEENDGESVWTSSNITWMGMLQHAGRCQLAWIL